MVDIAKLGVAVDTSQVDGASGDLNKFAGAAKTAETAAVGLGNRTAAATPKIAAAGNTAQKASAQINMVGGSTANLAAQFNDIGVMLAAGQNPLMLALQQGTQVNQVFAQMDGGASRVRALGTALMSVVSPANLVTLGIIAGGAALAQWAIGAITAGREAEELADLVDNVSDAMRALGQAQSANRITMIEATEEYGAYADAAREVLNVQREIAAIDAQRAISETARAISTAFGDITDALSTGESIADVVDRNFALGTLVDRFDIGIVRATELAAALVAIGDAQGPEQQAEASARLREQLELAAGGLALMDEETRAVYDSLLAAELAAARLSVIDVASNIGAGADEAARMAGNLNAALAIAEAISRQNAQNAYNVPAGRGGDPRRFGTDYASVFNQPGDGGTNFTQSGMARPGVRPEVRTGIDFDLGPAPRGGGRGGGRGGLSDEAREAQRRQNEMTREAQRIYDQTRTALENYNAEVADLTELHEMGYLNADTFGRAMQDLNEEFRRTEFADIISEIDSFSDSFGQMIGQAENLGDVFKGLGDIFADTLARMASEWASRGMNDLLTALVFGAGGGLTGTGSILSGIFGGFRAEGGPVSSGKGYIVGENGPEWFSPGTSGSITPNHALGGGTMNINVNLAGANGDAAIEAAAMRGVQMAVQQVSRNMANDPNFGRPT